MLATSAEASALCEEHGYPLLAGMSLSYSPRLTMLVAGATALLDDGTNDEFERALIVPDATRWPFDLARVHLTYANGYAGFGHE